MNIQKILTTFVVLIVLMGLFSGTAVAKEEKKVQDTKDKNLKDDTKQEDDSCPDGSDDTEEDVREEVVGVSPDGTDLLMKRTTIHRGGEKAKLNEVSKNGKVKLPATTVCYSLMGVKWNTFPVTYTINPINSGLDELFLTDAFSKSVGAWDAATSKALFGTYTINPTAPFGVVDGKNAMVFGDNYPVEGVIAVTYTWYYLRAKTIVEFDISYETDYTWGDGSADSSKMDVQNIATHEIGHGVGLKDLYTTTCKEQTMYGYASNGETKKRTLESGDIAGIVKIYG